MASGALAELLVRMDLNAAAIRTGLDKVSSQLSGFGGQLKGIGQSIQTAFTVEAIQRCATALADFVMAGVDAGDTMNRLSIETGLPADQLSRLSYAARLSNLSADDLGTSIAKLSKNMSEAAQGAEGPSRAFEAIGVKATDSAGRLRPVGDVLGDIADKFSTYENGAAKSALAQEFFGRSGAGMIDFLNNGRRGLGEMGDELDRMGGTITPKAAAEADRFKDNLERLKVASESVARKAAAELLPTLDGLIEKFIGSKSGAEALSHAAQVLAVFLKGLVSVGLGVAAAFKVIVDGLGALVFAAIEVSHGRFKEAWEGLKNGGADMVRDVTEGFGQIVSVWDDTAAQVEAKSEGTSNKIAAPTLKAKAKVEKAVDEIAKAMQGIDREAASMQERLAGMGSGGEFDKMLVKLRTGSLADELSKLSPEGREAQEARLLDLAKAIDAKAAADKRAEEAQRAHDAIMREGAELTAQMRTPLEELNVETDRANYLYLQGAINVQTYVRAVEKAQADYAEATSKMSEFTKSFASGLQNVFEDQIFDGFSKGLDGMVDAFGKMLRKMIAQALAAKLMQALGFGPGGAAAGGLDALGGFLGFGGGRAEGGSVRSDRWYVVGEKGVPEIFAPGVAGEIVPMQAPSSSGPGGAGGRWNGTLEIPGLERLGRMTLREAVEGVMADAYATRGG